MSDRPPTPPRNQMCRKGMKSEVRKKKKRKKGEEGKKIEGFSRMKNDPSIPQGKGRGSGKRRMKDRHIGEKLRLFSALMWNFKEGKNSPHNTTQKTDKHGVVTTKTTTVNLIKAGKSPNSS